MGPWVFCDGGSGATCGVESGVRVEIGASGGERKRCVVRGSSLSRGVSSSVALGSCVYLLHDDADNVRWSCGTEGNRASCGFAREHEMLRFQRRDPIARPRCVVLVWYLRLGTVAPVAPRVSDPSVRFARGIDRRDSLEEMSRGQIATPPSGSDVPTPIS